MSTGILGLSVADAPIAVIDFETTGLSAGYDRVVEVSVVRVEEGGLKRTLVLDTLVNPRCRVSAKDIHGITGSMVKNAPEFRDVWPALRAALAGCVVAAYNAYFDIRFLTAEALRAGEDVRLPYFCLMYIRPLIGVGERCQLSVACQGQGIRQKAAHRSARDAMATAELIPGYIQAMRANGLNAYQALRRAGSHKYLQSFALQPLTAQCPQRHCEFLPRERAHSRVPSLFESLGIT